MTVSSSKKKKPAKSDDAKIDEALLKIALATAPYRSLIKQKGQVAGEYLFANQTAADSSKIIGPDLFLIELKETESGPKIEFTDEGAQRLIVVLKTYLVDFPHDEQIAILNRMLDNYPLANTQLLPLFEATIRQSTEQQAREEQRVLEQIRLEQVEKKRLNEARSAIQRRMELLDIRKSERVNSLQRQLEADGVTLNREEGVLPKPPMEAKEWVINAVTHLSSLWQEAVKKRTN